MLLEGLVVDSHNLLDGTWRVASTTLQENDSSPAIGSIAAAEIGTGEVGPSGPWGEEPARTAFSFAVMTNFAAADHLGCLARLIEPGGIGGIFGSLVIARSCIEASARSWWLLDPNISVRERVGRSFRVRLRSVDETRHLLKELIEGSRQGENGAGHQRFIDDLEVQRVRRVEILGQAVDRGIPVHYRDGSPIGINVAMPNADELVGALLRSSGAALGAAFYALLSGVSHATHYALIQYFRDVGSSEPLETHMEPWLSDESLWTTTTLVVFAFLTSFGRLVQLYGWDGHSWESWDKHVRLKVAEMQRKLVATRQGVAATGENGEESSGGGQ